MTPVRACISPFLLALGAWALPSSVRADLPPPDDYVEECTVEKAQTRTKQACQSCSAWHGDADACTKQFAGSTFAHECRSYGASTWSEVWCDPKQAAGADVVGAGLKNDAEPAPAPDAPPPSAASSRGCAIGHGDGRGGAPAGLAIAVLVLARRRRRAAPVTPA